VKILLIQPAKKNDGSVASGHWALCKPYSLMYLKIALENSGRHSAEIFDLEREYLVSGDIDLGQILQKSDADLFGLTAATFTRFEAIAVAKTLKELFPHKLVVVGGVHFMNCDEDTIAHVSSIDAVVRGEGEKILLDFMDAVQNNRPLGTVDGITWRDASGRVVKNQDATLFSDLDAVEVYKQYPVSEYPEKYFGSDDPIPAVSIMTSRGCPYHCVFCAKSGMKYRHRSPDSVIAEIKYYRDVHGIRAFNFLDLTFTANAKRAQELCRRMIKEKLGIRWWCETRANIPLPLLDLMAKAGCDSFVLGVETGSVRMLKSIQKGVTLAEVEAVVGRSTKNNMKPYCYFMFSHPGETFDDAKQTIEYIAYLWKRYRVKSALQPCLIFPGTKIESMAKKSGLLAEGFSWADNYDSPFNEELGQIRNIPLFKDCMSDEELKKIWLLVKTVKHYLTPEEKLIEKYATVSLNRVFRILKRDGIWGILYSFLEDLRKAGFALSLVEFFQRIVTRIQFGDGENFSVQEKWQLFFLSGSESGITLLEVGSSVGLASRYLALGSKNNPAVKVFCVDSRRNVPASEGQSDAHKEFLSNTKRFGNQIVPLRGSSVDVARDFDKKIDLIFFDGDHTHEGVKADVDAWLPKVRSGGIVIMHDVGWAEGVQRVLREDVLPLVDEKGRLPNMFWGVKR